MNPEHQEIIEFVNLAFKLGLKSLTTPNYSFEFADKPKPVISIPPPKLEDLIKQDEMPSDDEMLYMSCSHGDEILAQKEEGLTPPIE
jgi:hypothetical protein